MRKVLGVLAMGALLVGAMSLGTQGQPKNDISEFMRAKLAHAQQALEGIALEDYTMIRKNAQELSLLSQASNWQVFETPEYVQHSAEFRRAADAMDEAAKNHNLDGAALAYMDMTMKCVNCHKYVRDVRMASAPNMPLFPTSAVGR